VHLICIIEIYNLEKYVQKYNQIIANNFQSQLSPVLKMKIGNETKNVKEVPHQRQINFEM
jgi:hypothetical protein